MISTNDFDKGCKDSLKQAGEGKKNKVTGKVRKGDIMRFFNTAGPVDCEDHYCIPPLKRFDLEEMLLLIKQKKYFVLHAPRQTGKTSCLLALMEHLNRTGKYRCLYINAEMAQTAREDVERGIRTILGDIGSRSEAFLDDSFPEQVWPDVLAQQGGDGALNKLLSLWAERSPLPLVLLIDEIDALIGDTLISVLRQLRAGYDKRPARFPQSIILCGVRDVRDYRIHSARDRAIITGGSAFNVKAASLRMGDFSQKEVYALYLQHTGETGQVFREASLGEIWRLTQGQPWLTNALGYELCFEMRPNRDRSVPVTPEMVSEARENLILRRDTHLDQLADKLTEERVRRVVGPLLSGSGHPELIPPDDLIYARDLGLIKTHGHIRIANPIYREVIPRELTYSTQLTIAHETAWYVRKTDGQLDMEQLITAFQEFFRQHSRSWEERFQYKEAGPQLLMQAFLQRILNSGGRVEREYGFGRGRTDLFVSWPYEGGTQKVVIELKVRRKEALETVIDEGLDQTRAYMDESGADRGHLLIFDRNEAKTWDEKIFKRKEGNVTVWGM